MILISLTLAHARPLDLSGRLNADLIEPAGNDAWCVPVQAEKATLPVGVPAGQVQIRWMGDAGAVVELIYADGTRLKTSVPRGTEVGNPAGPSARAVAAQLGRDSAGKTVWGAEWTWGTGRPDETPTELVVTRSGGKRVCITNIEVLPDDIGVASDTTGWYPFPIGSFPTTPYPLAVPVEAPAGKRGAVSVDTEGHLRFADGTRARFWGVDLYTRNALPQKADADRYAAGLAGLGVNIVRMHHLDLDTRALLNPKRSEPGQPTFDADALDRLDFFISRLHAHGIYLFLEFATGRRLLPSDGVSGPGFAPSGHKLLPMWLPDWEAAYIAHWRGVWDRVNPYLGKRYADDPGVAVVELSNEHSLVMGWGGATQALAEVYRAALADRFTAWLRSRYADDAALKAAWSCSCANPGLVAGESLTTRIGLDPGAASLASAWPEKRRLDLLRFFGGLERDFYARMTKAARDAGFNQPLSPTLGYTRPEVEALHDTAQVADMHISWDYPPGLDSLKNVSWIANPWAERTVEGVGALPTGRAISISELNHPVPNVFQAEAPWAWTMFASVQDWDILIWNDMQLRNADTDWDFAASDLSIHPLNLAQFTAASSAFRAGWIPAAAGFSPLYWSEAALEEQLVGRYAPPAAAATIPALLASRFRAVLGGTAPPAVPGKADPGIGWWSDPGVLSIDQPKLRVRIGPPATAGKDGIGPLTPIGLEVETTQWAAVALSSADGADLARSGRALLTVATRQEFTGQRLGQAGTAWLVHGTLPVLVEPFRGRIRFAFPSKPTVTRLSATGARMAPVKVSAKGNLWEVTLDDSVQSPIFLVEAGGDQRLR